MIGKILASLFFGVNGKKLQPYVEEMRITQFDGAISEVFTTARCIERGTCYVTRNIEVMNEELREDLTDDFMTYSEFVINDGPYPDIEFWIYMLYKSNKFEWIVPKWSEEQYIKYSGNNKFNYLIEPLIEHMFRKGSMSFWDGWPYNTKLSFAVQKTELKWSAELWHEEDVKFYEEFKKRIGI